MRADLRDGAELTSELAAGERIAMSGTGGSQGPGPCWERRRHDAAKQVGSLAGDHPQGG